jgi:hypothetical protein
VLSGDVKAVQKAIDDGGDVNAKNEYGISALWIVCGKDNFEVIETLVKHGADVNARDDIWYMTLLSAAARGQQLKTVQFLIKSGAKDVDAALLSAVGARNQKLLEVIFENSKVAQETLDAALFMASTKATKEWLAKNGAKPIPPPTTELRKAWANLVGTFESDGGKKLTIELKDAGLLFDGRIVKSCGVDSFAPLGPPGTSYRIEQKNGVVTKITVKRFTAEYGYYRFKEPPAQFALVKAGAGAMTATLNWPSFRGPDGTGVADGQHPPLTWNTKTGEGVRWKTPIPGLGHSCPVVWGDRVFVTTAISSGQADPKIRVGNYGDVESVDDKSKHT